MANIILEITNVWTNFYKTSQGQCLDKSPINRCKYYMSMPVVIRMWHGEPLKIAEYKCLMMRKKSYVCMYGTFVHG